MFDKQHVKKLVEEAIRSRDFHNGPDWRPIHGGEYRCNEPEAVIIFHPASRFQKFPMYSLCGPEFGKWVGRLNGATGHNVGKPVQNHPPYRKATEDGKGEAS